MNCEKFDWQTRDDAETLKRAQAIKNDAVRLKRAQDYIRDSIVRDKQVLNKKVYPQTPSRGNNPATIKPLNPFLFP